MTQMQIRYVIIFFPIFFFCFVICVNILAFKALYAPNNEINEEMSIALWPMGSMKIGTELRTGLKTYIRAKSTPIRVPFNPLWKWTMIECCYSSFILLVLTLCKLSIAVCAVKRCIKSLKWNIFMKHRSVLSAHLLSVLANTSYFVQLLLTFLILTDGNYLIW